VDSPPRRSLRSWNRGGDGRTAFHPKQVSNKCQGPAKDGEDSHLVHLSLPAVHRSVWLTPVAARFSKWLKRESSLCVSRRLQPLHRAPTGRIQRITMRSPCAGAPWTGAKGLTVSAKADLEFRSGLVPRGCGVSPHSGAERGSRTPTRLPSSVFEFAERLFADVRQGPLRFAKRGTKRRSVRRRSPKFVLIAVKPLSAETSGGGSSGIVHGHVLTCA
jgi:hypothetical protein